MVVVVLLVVLIVVMKEKHRDIAYWFLDTTARLLLGLLLKGKKRQRFRGVHLIELI